MKSRRPPGRPWARRSAWSRSGHCWYAPMNPARKAWAGTPAAPFGASRDLIFRPQIDRPPGRTRRGSKRGGNRRDGLSRIW